ncbi:hypothetical protein [Nonomuraea jabiensis]|uniref:hypothetical protein n=1 Tax=Nonomuraea jabiensis TaxID=882448 RepID=UPI003675373A
MYEPTPEDRFASVCGRPAARPDRYRALAAFRKALAETGLKVPMVTINPFTHPVLRDGAFTSNDRDEWRYAARGYHFPHLNQLALEHLLGVRG